ncbi:holin [Pseudomonas phage Persinger]|uniref:Holin n=1 Tax=Pseudomonas phage Persinger TaxID=2749430 RepID=A0A7D7IC14_9CAUD|nr:holin [Pseudomonas phage Persinger]QMP19223.1 holin [Pseudomonas phage Persinger]
MDFLERLLNTDKAIIAGFIGALVALKFQEELSGWGGRAWFVCTGVACAYWGTPWAISAYSIDPGLAGSVGFLLGAFGGSLLAAGFRAIKNLDLISLVKAKIGKTGGGE